MPLRLEIKVRHHLRHFICLWLFSLLFPFRPLTPQKQLTARSDRVKSVDIHPSDVSACYLCLMYMSMIELCRPFHISLATQHPWVLAALYNGFVYIWDYTTNVSKCVF
jgi:hypothetical protein